MNEKTKILFLDLDDTLLRSDKTISDYTLETLAECKKRGILIGFSTSRGQMKKSPYTAQVQPDIIIGNGGASVIYENKLILSESFTAEETQRLLSKAYEVCGDSCEITLDTEEAIYWNRETDKSTNYAFDALYSDFKAFPEPALKICVQTEDAVKADRIASCVQDAVLIKFSDIPWYKISSAKGTKENAILFISKFLKVPLAEMAAFGDDFSDIGMLKLCGTGVAMGNAIPDVKAAADFVAETNNDDGVAHFIREHIL
ncbi:MAG: HAD family hydrolase [Treponemataceae bacterium]|nr:HAD family hydrolase [Treponemataceae bacterium]